MSDSTANPSVLHRLKAGIRRYQSEVHAERAAEYQRAATTPQQPHTLVIACADSRVDVESVAGAAARGELTLSGWVYEIGSGQVRIVEDGSRGFVPVTAEEALEPA